MNSACPRRASLITSWGLPTILSPTISALTGDRPVASGFIPASTGFAFCQQTRPSTPTESSSRRLPLRGRLCYGLVVLVPLLSTPHRCDAVTVRYHTALHRTEADFHRSIPSLSQAHWHGPLARAVRRPAGRNRNGHPTRNSGQSVIRRPTLPVGESPTGTGGSPVTPIPETATECREIGRAHV